MINENATEQKQEQNKKLKESLVSFTSFILENEDLEIEAMDTAETKVKVEEYDDDQDSVEV